MHVLRRSPALLLLVPLLAPLPSAAAPSCLPCAGVSVADPSALLTQLSRPLEEGEVFFVKWTADLGAPDAAAAAAASLAERGIVPWLAVPLTTPPPLLDNAAQLAAELESLAALSRILPPGVWVQLLWQPHPGQELDLQEYAFLVKRASVAVTGAQPDALVASAPLPTAAEPLRSLYAEEVAAYLDAIAFPAAPPTEVERLAAVLRELDPAATVVVDGIAQPPEPNAVLAAAAAYAARGAGLGLFRLGDYTQERLQPFLLLAHEFQGDLAADPYSVPTGAEEAWSFVRGSDLHLRIVVRNAEETGRDLVLRFPDRQLSSPSLFDPASGEAESVFGGRRTDDGYELTLSEAPAVLVLGFERLSAAQLAGMDQIEEQVEVADARQMPVEEILKRLQAFEDAQQRRLLTYSALNTSHLRFQFGTATRSVETTFEGDFFFRQGEGYDWAWQSFYINGVRWRRKTIPQIPLIQPEKAASLPGDITFSPAYRYRLRGTAVVAGRDCWVVDFQPSVAVEPGRSLYQGTVWVDREHYGRLQTRAVQLGLEGDVVSNEETMHYRPVDAAGQEAEWTSSSYWLPTRIVGQQLWQLLDQTIVVERETRLSRLQINPADFEEARQQALASEATMVRDTEEGLRYLVADKETGQRVVQEKPDSSRLFVLGGAFYDESQDGPIPLAGVNWLSFDLKGTGAQANVFFAGALLTADLATPQLFGSKFRGAVDVFALGIAGTDTRFRNGEEVPEEDVEVLSPNIDLRLGRPIGSFVTLDLEYSLGYTKFSRADDTAPEFVLPSDTLTHTAALIGTYNRSGYRLRLRGSVTRRDEWEPWGLPGFDEFDPDQEEFSRWGGALAKTWHLPNFRKVGLEVEYVGGENLDRFSKYEFGFFSDIRVHGYQSDKVRAEEAWATHFSYGFGLGDFLRIDFLADAAWVTDEAAGFDRELLAGVGVSGTFVGPWGTVVNLDVGAAVDGPDDGVSVFVAFLKLFGKS